MSTTHPAPARKFKIMVNGDDAMSHHTADDYEAAVALAAELSVDHWLGHKVIGPSGKIATYFDGKLTGFLSKGEWVAR